jgi:flagellar hook-basal body complex protein FliE
MTVSAVASAQSLFGSTEGISAGPPTDSSDFLSLVNAALRGVSDTQNAAATAESGYAVGASGATLGNALVASDRAEVAWNATVAVRNEVVSAYQSVMSMQF